MKNLIELLVLSCVFLLSSCDSIDSVICGELDQQRSKMLAEVNEDYKQILRVELIPCEGKYVNLFFETIIPDTTILRNVHNRLYNGTPAIGWQSLWVHDLNKNYMFTHSYNGYSYVQE